MRNLQHSCGLDAAMDVVGGKWKALILWSLAERVHRFGELRRAIPGVSEKMLSQHLRELEGDGIVCRTDYDEVPPRVEYSLTEDGVALNDALAPLNAWGQRRMEALGVRHDDAGVASQPQFDPRAYESLTSSS